ncbi:MAG: SGNH/GDSL hydrolase family protein [Syntrophales bacterium]|nr:SGNH/GDSL hydrolase family protein [Syntrophales bacterium]
MVKNLALAAVSAVILLYFNIPFFWSYLLLLLVLFIIFLTFFPNPHVKMGKFIANTATVIATFFILAVFLEICLYIAPHFFMASRNPDILGEFSDFTSRGYLTPAVFNKEKGVFRILSIGDSFAANFPDGNRNHNYNAFLQKKFAQLSGRKVEIVNAGMICTGPGYYLHTLNKFGGRFQPDLVLVGFFEGNDFLEYECNDNFGDLIWEPHELKRKILGYRNFDGFRLSKLIRHRYIQYREKWRMAQLVKEKGPQAAGSFSEESFMGVERARTVFFKKDRQAFLDGLWRQGAPVMLRIKQWCDDRKVPLVLAIFPDQLQVDQALRQELFRRYKIREDSLDLDYPNSLLRRFCRENHIYCLDLFPPFQKAGKTRELYLLHNTHWNAAGNRLAADLIFQFLMEHKLIKSN